MDYDGLTTRLLAAIEETEQIAQAAIRWSEGASEWADGENPDWVHIARHDPATELIRCAADRKIVACYQRARGALEEAPRESRAFVRCYLDACEDVLDHLAAGYGLTITEVPDGHNDH